MVPRLLPSGLSSLVLLISATAPALGDLPTVDDGKCNCYMANDTETTYYQNHKFFDFRTLGKHQGTPDIVQDSTGATSAPPSSDYFKSETWTSFWETQNWNNSETLAAANASYLRINSRSNVYIETNKDSATGTDTYMTLRTARLPQFQTSAEVVTQSNSFQFVSMRMLARTHGSPGGCTAMFTYRPPTLSGGIVQEADFEVLTKYPKNQVQCTNQPSLDLKSGDVVPGATLNATLPGGLKWDRWNVYRMDWTPKRTTWFVNGEQLANISFQVPRDTSRLHLNAWSDGGPWTGVMAFGGETHMQVQWWEVLYNSTEKKVEPGSVCKAVCSVDQAKELGKVVMVSNSLAAGRLLSRLREDGGLAALVAWIPSIATVLSIYMAISP